VLLQAEQFAGRLQREAGADVASQVERAFRVALARPPEAGERQMAIAFVRQDGLAAFCHALFNLNEFVYRP
jgi:hypothetical protein